MSITVSFYNNKSDNRYLTKDLALLAEDIQCSVYLPCDRLNPILILDKDTIQNVLTECNYCIIPEFGRKYFITDISGAAGNKVQLVCHVDVLGTYDEEIRYCPVIAARSSNQPNYYLEDDMRLFNTYVQTQYLDVGSPIGQPDTIVLITLSQDIQ